MDQQLKKLIKIAESLDSMVNDVVDLPSATEIAQTGDAIEENKLIIAIRLGIVVRQLARAGIQPGVDGWGPLDQRLHDVRQTLGE